MNPRLSLVVAACSNRGIGINGKLPWRLSGDMKFFKKITTETQDEKKRNAVIMGRKTWDSIPEKMRPLANRVNVVISTTLQSVPNGVHIARSMDDALSLLSSSDIRDSVETCFVIGGSYVYETALASPYCHRVYLTEVLKEFDCDTFLPEFDWTNFKTLNVTGIPSEVQEENGIQYKYVVYEKLEEKSNGVNVDCKPLDSPPVYISVAMDLNCGIGNNGALPWSLPKEFSHFLSLISHREDPEKKVVIIKGRKTWDSSLPAETSLPFIINIVISQSLRECPDNVSHVVQSFDEAMNTALSLYRDGVAEKIWILGGHPIYQAAIESPLCQRIYLTRIQSEYSCDTFFPSFEDKFRRVESVHVDESSSVEDNGIRMNFEVYERKTCQL